MEVLAHVFGLEALVVVVRFLTEFFTFGDFLLSLHLASFVLFGIGHEVLYL